MSYQSSWQFYANTDQREVAFYVSAVDGYAGRLKMSPISVEFRKDEDEETEAGVLGRIVMKTARKISKTAYLRIRSYLDGMEDASL